MLTFTNIHHYSKVAQFHSDERIKPVEIVMSKELIDERERSLIFVKSTTHPKVFTYGLKQLEDGIYHNSGYVWSSRVGCVNTELEQDFVEVYIDNCSGYCMHKDDLQAFLPEGYVIEKKTTFNEDEIRYGIVKANEKV